MEERLPKGTLGGQAVIEGVMMKGTDSYSVAIRKPDKKIEVKLQKYQSYGEKHGWAKVPFIRGIVNFTESMIVGLKTLSYSSSFYEEVEEETKADKFIKDVFKEKAESVIIGLTFLCSVIIAIALFMLAPAAIAEFIGKYVDSRILLSLIEGIIRLAVFIVYVVLISQMEDIKRVFMYHGAEHKTINCYESGDDLTPENVAKHSRYHKRCGTSFLFIVMVVSIVVFMFITADQMWLRFLLRLLLIPVIAGISYEFIRLAGRTDNTVMNVLSKPGMWIQKLTTKEPAEEMIQVAIISVESVLYGKLYVDAVNQAQGIGVKEEPQKKEDVKDKEFFEETVEEDGVSETLEAYEEIYEEYEEADSFEGYEEYESTDSFEEVISIVDDLDAEPEEAVDNKQGADEKLVKNAVNAIRESAGEASEDEKKENGNHTLEQNQEPKVKDTLEKSLFEE